MLYRPSPMLLLIAVLSFPQLVKAWKYDPTAPVDSDWEGGPHLHGTPAYWRGPDVEFAYVYAWGEQDYLRAQDIDDNGNRHQRGEERK